jgi:small acid-soluble spore protein F (minor alpha/beta-type SASP)
MVEKKQDMLKFEVANELGLAEKVLKFGWKSLSAKETGKIGGLVSKRKKSIQETGTGLI